MLRCGLEVLRSLTLQHGLLRRCVLEILRSLILQHGPVLRGCLVVLRSLTPQHGLMPRCGLVVLRSPRLQHGMTLRRGLEANATAQHNAAYWFALPPGTTPLRGLTLLLAHCHVWPANSTWHSPDSVNPTAPGPMPYAWSNVTMRLINMSFPPDPVHTPGVGHVIADRPSRVHAPDGLECELQHLHPALLHAVADTVPPRTAAWYKS